MKELTQKQEKFAQCVASGMSQADAYRTAYNSKGKPETAQANASRMMANSMVAARVNEIQKEGAKQAAYTLAEHLKRLDSLSRGAEQAEKYEAAIKAEELRGKASGLYTERHDLTTNGESINRPASELTDDEIAAIIRKG